jgi:hypothetical protein
MARHCSGQRLGFECTRRCPAGNADVDLGVYGAPKSIIERPAAFTVEGPNTQHVAYRGTNNHIYEVHW